MDFLIDISMQSIKMQMVSTKVSSFRHKILLYSPKKHGMKQFKLLMLTMFSAVISSLIDSSWLLLVDAMDKVMLYPCPVWEGRHNGN